MACGSWLMSVTQFARRRGVLHHVSGQFDGNIIRCKLVRSNSGVLVKLSKNGSSLTLIRLLTQHTHICGPHFSIITMRMIVGGVPCRDSMSCLERCMRS